MWIDKEIDKENMGKIVRITDSKVGVVGGGGIDIYYTILSSHFTH